MRALCMCVYFTEYAHTVAHRRDRNVVFDLHVCVCICVNDFSFAYEQCESESGLEVTSWAATTMIAANVRVCVCVCITCMHTYINIHQARTSGSGLEVTSCTATTIRSPQDCTISVFMPWRAKASRLMVLTRPHAPSGTRCAFKASSHCAHAFSSRSFSPRSLAFAYGSLKARAQT
jgi:hypothetical protein